VQDFSSKTWTQQQSLSAWGLTETPPQTSRLTGTSRWSLKATGNTGATILERPGLQVAELMMIQAENTYSSFTMLQSKALLRRTADTGTGWKSVSFSGREFSQTFPKHKTGYAVEDMGKQNSRKRRMVTQGTPLLAQFSSVCSKKALFAQPLPNVTLCCWRRLDYLSTLNLADSDAACRCLQSAYSTSHACLYLLGISTF
jgi:hypothetical protein